MRFGSEKGQALILAVMVMVVVITTSIVALSLSRDQKMISNYQRDKVQAYYNADSGIERVLARLSQDPGWVDKLPLNSTVNFYVDDNVEVKVEKKLDLEKIKLFILSEGYHNRGKQTLEAVIEFDSPLKILSWKEKYPVFVD